MDGKAMVLAVAVLAGLVEVEYGGKVFRLGTGQQAAYGRQERGERPHSARSVPRWPRLHNAPSPSSRPNGASAADGRDVHPVRDGQGVRGRQGGQAGQIPGAFATVSIDGSAWPGRGGRDRQGELLRWRRSARSRSRSRAPAASRPRRPRSRRRGPGCPSTARKRSWKTSRRATASWPCCPSMASTSLGITSGREASSAGATAKRGQGGRPGQERGRQGEHADAGRRQGRRQDVRAGGGGEGDHRRQGGQAEGPPEGGDGGVPCPQRPRGRRRPQAVVAGEIEASSSRRARTGSTSRCSAGAARRRRPRSSEGVKVTIDGKEAKLESLEGGRPRHGRVVHRWRAHPFPQRQPWPAGRTAAGAARGPPGRFR